MMEASTLMTPPRPVMVPPVQKSLSLPSYARASGEGIDHKLIFAALEQREKIRRKSKIFNNKEKTGATRQSYFCLPLSSKKCKETSLSSDTSCSSLEFQKPKQGNSPCVAKKLLKDDIAKQELSIDNGKIDLNNNSDEGPCIPLNNLPTYKECPTKTRQESLRNTMYSSDSMERTERSSKSSTDSITRKERLTAIKARVEAERERTLGGSSSEEEEISLRITRHNSDGVIHRTVREVKTKSSRAERRFRRKNTEESSQRRAARKQHRSLYLPTSTDLDSWKPPIVRSGSSYSLQKDLEELSKDFLDLESKSKFPGLVPKDCYFSDISSSNYKSRYVKPIVDEIEAKEQRFSRENSLKNQSDIIKKINNCITPPSERIITNSPNPLSNGNALIINKCIKFPESRASPTFKAPTPPPRSPKSIEFVNKVFFQHHNSNFYQESRSLERNDALFLSKPTLTSNQPISYDICHRDILKNRRKTCTTFGPIVDVERPTTPSLPHQTKFPPRSPDLIQKYAVIGRKSKAHKDAKPTPVQGEVQSKSWDKREMDSEKKFNSIDSQTPPNQLNWKKWRWLPKSDRDYSSNFNQNINSINQQTSTTEESVQTESGLKIHDGTNNLSQGSLIHKSINPQSMDFEKQIINREQISQFNFVSPQDATDNLNIAMEELENVYKTLQFSSDNLSEDTKEDLNPKSSTYPVHNSVICNGFIDNCSIPKKVNSDFSTNPVSIQPDEESLRLSEQSLKDALCIEELFGDLTEQLDLEQKLLHESKGAKVPSSPKQSEIRHRPANLPPSPSSCITDEQFDFVTRKKHKAIRSLSASIASIMRNDPFYSNDTSFSSPNMNAKNKMADQMTSESMKVNPEIFTKTENSTEHIKHSVPDEIWQVRVSMDPGEVPANPLLPSDVISSPGIRLQSALRRRNENIVLRNPTEANECLQRNTRDKTAPLLNETELELLLTTLLRDVSNSPTTERKLSSLLPKGVDDSKVAAKDAQSNVTKRHFVPKMEPGVSPHDRTKNEKNHQARLPSDSDVLLDNDGNHNNNEMRERSFARGYRVSNDNRAIPSHRNSAFVENISSPRPPWLSGRTGLRRHSVGLDDFSGLSIYCGQRNGNQVKRNTTFDRTITRCSSDSTAIIACPVDITKLQSQSENQNHPRNIELSMQNTCNGSSLTDGPVNINPEKVKDKSFVRKSSLNRLDLVEPACHAIAHSCNPQTPSQLRNSQQSSSETTSDRDRCDLIHSPSSTKRKNYSNSSPTGKNSNCDLSNQESNQASTKAVWNFNMRVRDGSLKLKNKKNSKIAHFKKRSYSAGEQDSNIDIGENSRKMFGLSSYQTKSNSTTENPIVKTARKVLTKQSGVSIDDEDVSSELNHSLMNKELLNQNIISHSCDNSSHISNVDDLSKPCEADSSADEYHDSVEIPQDVSSSQNQMVACCIEDLEIDKDLFEECPSVPSSLQRFPTDDLNMEDFQQPNINADDPSKNLQYMHSDMQGMEQSDGELQSYGMTEERSRNISPSDSDKESSKQPSSILRKKYFKDRREIHGILKNAEEKLSARHRPSILKHRESSEEKDNWYQSDLHSILKKSSEDESSSNSPDIRPILKNTSTDDESSGCWSKPKPILKKRTSFSEECSYASYYGSELKPILKKKSIIEIPDDQPRPILKTRRKSEEATVTLSEFPIGSRPRAYSADRGVKMASEKKTSEEI